MTAFHFFLGFLGVTFIVTSVVLFAEAYDMWGKKD